jgi:UDP-N-acetylmuramoyl-tripeptide--D-alanyl-D-alanine ligase
MLLSRDFLLKAVPYAKFYSNGVELRSESDWDFYNFDEEVCVAFDSRFVSSGTLFFALKGQTVDGHDFLQQAIAAGASAAVVSKVPKLSDTETSGAKYSIPETSGSQALDNLLIIVVPDTYTALVDMAKAWRATLQCPIVGITGSIGKTSTKEILRSILQKTDIPFYISEKNQNTFIGLCINMLNVKKNCKVAAFEVGMSEPGEIAAKADILCPSIGLITKISYSHISQLGSLQNVAQEKRQLFKNFKGQEIGIIFGDQSILTDVNYAHPIARYGFKTKNHVQARMIKNVIDSHGNAITEFNLKWYGYKAKVKFNTMHTGLLSNALAASTIAYFVDVPFSAVVSGIESYVGFDNRFEPKRIKDNLGTIISDCYNANPESMKAAILAFDKMVSTGKKIAVIGDMLELGHREIYWHRNLGKLLNKASSIKSIILVGNLVRYTQGMISSGVDIVRVKDWQEAEQVLKTQISHTSGTLVSKAAMSKTLASKTCASKQSNCQALVLVKASHGISLDKLVSRLVV